MIEKQPKIILETKRLLFRQHVMADMDAFSAMEQDPEVRRYVGGYPRTREEAERRFLNNIAGPATDKLSMWATIYKAENKYIGRCGIYPHFDNSGQPIPGEASLGLYVASPYWGNGFATEAGNAFIELGFNELNINRIVTAIQVGNDASVHVIEKLGFKLVWTETGGFRDFLHYALQNPQK